MTLGIKLLVGGVALATVSCGGYVVYTKVTSSSSEEKSATQNVSGDPSPSAIKAST